MNEQTPPRDAPRRQDSSPTPRSDADRTQEFVRDDVARSAGSASGPGSPAPHGSHGSRAWRVVLAVVAACVIAFCAWAMSQYVHGRDPLGRPVAETSVTPSAETPAASITHDDVVSAIGTLSYGGADVSVPADEMTVVLQDGSIWVEQITDDAALDMVNLTAERACALGSWAQSKNCGVTDVVWISEDLGRSVRMAIRYPTSAADTTASLQTLLQNAAAYHISADAYAACGPVDFPREAGDAITLPDGSAVEVSSQATAGGEVLEGATPADVVAGRSVVASSGQAAAASGSGSVDAADTIAVSVVVDGSAAGGGVTSASLTLPAGSTAYDALRESGVSVNARSTSMGVYVAGIDGLEEKEHGGSSGWVYSVNGSEPNVSCGSYTLSSGDSVYWQYVNVTS